MQTFAGLFGRYVGQGINIHLQGALGAGKTTFVRGLLRSLGHEGAVKSPTYTLVESYQLQGHAIYHFDFYRLADAAELDSIGYRDYFDPPSCSLVEWPERAAGLLGRADLEIVLCMQNPGRDLSCTAGTALGQRALAEVRALV